MAGVLCDKCGFPVALGNNAVEFQILVDAIVSTRKKRGTVTVAAPPARHLLPHEHEGKRVCDGSPSRAQYLDGQPRDERYAYDSAREESHRLAYVELQVAAARLERKPAPTITIQWCNNPVMVLGRIVLDPALKEAPQIRKLAAQLGVSVVEGQTEPQSNDLWIGNWPDGGWRGLEGDAMWARSFEAPVVVQKLWHAKVLSVVGDETRRPPTLEGEYFFDTKSRGRLRVEIRRHTDGGKLTVAGNDGWACNTPVEVFWTEYQVVSWERRQPEK